MRVRQLDATDEKGIAQLACDIEEEFGRLDVLVNNAGISIDRGQHGVDADLGVVRETLEMNLFGAWRLCEVFVRLMQRNRYGRIVNVSAAWGRSTTWEETPQPTASPRHPSTPSPAFSPPSSGEWAYSSTRSARAGRVPTWVARGLRVRSRREPTPR